MCGKVDDQVCGGPVTSPEEVNRLVSDANLSEVEKQNRLFTEVRYARDTSLSLPKASPLPDHFRHTYKDFDRHCQSATHNSGVNLRKPPPLSPRNRFLVSLSREFCVDYNEKKFTAVKIAESMFFCMFTEAIFTSFWSILYLLVFTGSGPNYE